jgi:malonate decarboxylase delta subunit
MAGMETLHFAFDGGRVLPPFTPALVGVVASGNLEVLVESVSDTGCRIDIDTSARGFGPIWEAVLRDFHDRHGLGGLVVSIHDMGATPAVVSLRLDQAIAAISGAQP